jgi:mono/diheme cytochrome c family protein
MRRAACLLAAAAFSAFSAVAALPASAQTTHMTVTGRQVPARADAPSVSPTSSVRATYVVHCAGCHGLDGSGSRLGQVPDMRRLGDFLRLPGGREFIVSVPGVMGSGLSDADVAAVTNYVLASIAPGSAPPGTPPYSTEEVRRARARPLVDVAAQRRRLVEQGRAQGIELAAM